MKFRLMIVILFVCNLCVAETINPQFASGWQSITQNALRKDLGFLASDGFQGRLALQPGDNKAIHWIAAQFKLAGLQPGANGSYLQAVPLIEYLPDNKHSYLLLEQNGKSFKWHAPQVFTDFQNNINLSGDIVFAGYGITAPDLNYDDYQNIDVRGKIVMVFEHEPQETNAKSIFNGTANTIHATTHTKVLNAQKHGAIAVLIAPEPNRKHPSNQQRYARIGGAKERKTPLPEYVLAASEINIPYAILADKAAKKIAGKLSLRKLQLAIDKDLKPHSQLIPNTKVTLHDVNLSRKTGTTYNVVGLLEGSDPTLKQETIIISAHHDHDGMSGKSIWHGADDNASGTVGVVTLARAFAKNAEILKPKRSLLFVVFAAEEAGLLGAFHMTQHPVRALNTTKAMINFDMIGRDEKASAQTDGLIEIPKDTTHRLNLIGGHYSPDYLKIVKDENNLVGLTLDNRFDNENALNVFFRSDQFPFVLQDIPAFWWFTGFHPDYHHVSDTADKIDYPKMEKILKLAYLSAYRFANDKTSPGFIKNPM